MIGQRFVREGESVMVEGYGEVGRHGSFLVCRYFTGRSAQTLVLAYAPNNIMGRDECPFFEREP